MFLARIFRFFVLQFGQLALSGSNAVLENLLFVFLPPLALVLQIPLLVLVAPPINRFTMLVGVVGTPLPMALIVSRFLLLGALSVAFARLLAQFFLALLLALLGSFEVLHLLLVPFLAELYACLRLGEELPTREALAEVTICHTPIRREYVERKLLPTHRADLMSWLRLHAP